MLVSEEKFGEIIVVMRFLGSKSLWAGILGSLDPRIPAHKLFENRKSN
jgi:hypothetical protein